MMSHRWDFSVGNMMILACLFGVPLGKELRIGPWDLLITITLAGVIFGTINGLLYTSLKIPSLLISVGMMKIFECIGYLWSDRRPAELGGSGWKLFGRSPGVFILLIVMDMLVYYLYFCSSYGRNYFALRDGQGIL